MPILEEQMKYMENVNYLTNNSHCFKNLPFRIFQDNINNFRIVYMANGTDCGWYLLQKRTNIVSRFFGLFTKTFIQWRVVCGCDMGAPGYYNYQAHTTANPAAQLLHTIPDVLKAELGNRNLESLHREGYPRGPITKEMDIYKTIVNCKFEKETDIFHCILENAIIKDYDLDACLSTEIKP
jgi:hypothetical protein